jgi:hypothetical protein
MKVEAAAAGGIGRAKARNRAGDQNCCEKVFHVFSLARAATRRLISLQKQSDTLNISRQIFATSNCART